MNDVDTFRKIAQECRRFGQINCRQRLWMVTQSAINSPIWSHCRPFTSFLIHHLHLSSISSSKIVSEAKNKQKLFLKHWLQICFDTNGASTSFLCWNEKFFLLPAPSQDVFLLPHIPSIGQGASILLVNYSMMILKPAIFVLMTVVKREIIWLLLPSRYLLTFF